MSFRSWAISFALLAALLVPTGCSPQVTDGPLPVENESDAPAGGDSAGGVTATEDEVTDAAATSESEAAGDAAPANDELTAAPTPLADEAQPADAAPAALSIGDPAPPLTLAQWIKGNPIESFDNDQVYVVEFWATWCGPCRMSMPHISQLHSSYGDKVKFVGVSDETEGEVRQFLQEVQDEESGKTWNEVVTYAIAIDQSRATSRAYMEAANQNGIPTAFIVGKDGHIEWIGHPMEIDEVLPRVVDGTWDRKAAQLEFQSRLKRQEFLGRLSTVFNDPALQSDPSALEALIAEAETLDMPGVVPSIKFELAVRRGDVPGAVAAAKELAELNWDRAQQLNSIAWGLLDRTAPSDDQAAMKVRNDEALRIAERAAELTNQEDGSILDTLARAHAEAGNLKEAVTWQRKAVAAYDHPQIAETLKKYEEQLAAAEGGPEAAQSNAPDDAARADAAEDGTEPADGGTEPADEVPRP